LLHRLVPFVLLLVKGPYQRGGIDSLLNAAVLAPDTPLWHTSADPDTAPTQVVAVHDLLSTPEEALPSLIAALSPPSAQRRAPMRRPSHVNNYISRKKRGSTTRTG
jgi:hypothetical protein